MKRVRQLCFYVGVGLLLTAALAALGIHVENIRTRRKAESVLSAVHQLRVAESTFSSTQNILTEFGAKRWALSPAFGLPPESRYGIFVGNSLLCTRRAVVGLDGEVLPRQIMWREWLLD